MLVRRLSHPSAPPRPAAAQEKPQPKKWTVLVYSASDNDLYRFMKSDIDEMETVGSDDRVNVVAQFDHGRQGAQRLLVTKDQTKGELNSPVLQELGSTDMASPDTLADFVKWGMEHYPAEHYFLVMSDHGDGWKGACQDSTHGSWMSLPEIEEGLRTAREATGRKIDLLGFDACLMASAEVAHQLRNEADFLVASQEVEGGAGWPYNRLLSPNALQGIQQAVALDSELTPREMGRQVVTVAQGKQDDLPTMAAVDLSKMPAVAEAVDHFAAAVVASQVSRGSLRKLARRTESFTGYKDLYHFAQQVSEKVEDPGLKEAAQGVMSAVGSAVYAEQHSAGYPNAHGLTVQLPNFFFSPSSAYEETRFAQDTRWDDALQSMGKYWFWPWPL
ncbi:MAG: hypothetical protein HY319_21560 [Armatimonadetes bacterium]|nr:hypothetical protein [Armatimonadota bacterium]